jgi:Mg-chelatase subunit ChlD
MINSIFRSRSKRFTAGITSLLIAASGVMPAMPVYAAENIPAATTAATEPATDAPTEAATEAATEAPTEAATEPATEAAPAVIQPQQKVYELDGFEVTIDLRESWDTGYNAIVRLSNTGSEPIENWLLKSDYANQINSVWNARYAAIEDEGVLFMNSGWNADIAPGRSVEFGIVGTQPFAGFPEDFELVGENEEVEEEAYNVDYQLDVRWNDGFSGRIFLTNNTDKVLEDWELELDFDAEISEIWSASIISHDGTGYLFRNIGYNANIQPGQTISFGFKGVENTEDAKPENAVLRQIVPGSGKEEQPLQVTVDPKPNMYEYADISGYIVGSKLTDLTGTLNLPDKKIKSVTVSVVSGNTDVKQNAVKWKNGVWTLEEPQLLIGDNTLTVTAVSKKGVTSTATLRIWNTSYENTNLLGLDRNDNDEDGLMNFQEEQYGTDPDKKDTDGDGFTDIKEIFLLKTDPLVPDEDGDFDQDGLLNSEEIELNTDVFNADTEGDGLSDYDEVKVHGTDPKLVDTDRDGISDFLEVKYGTDPLTAEKLNSDGTLKVDYTPDQTGKDVEASISITLDPGQLGSFEMNDIKSDDPLLSDQIPGYIGEGAAYDFQLDGEFKEAILSFILPDGVWDDPDFEPGVYYYNEETGLLEELENVTWDGNKVTVPLEHFSKYILLNKKTYSSMWVYDLLFIQGAQNQSGLDIAFVIDSSGSMTSNDSSGIRKTVTNNFISKLTANDRAAVVDFDSSASVYSRFTNDKTALNAAVARINSSGGTNLSVGISTALNLFNASDYVEKNNQKCIIMLTDGQGSYSTSYTTTAKSMGVTIYTVGLGSSVSTSVLTNMAEGTGGSYFHASQADKLYGIFDRILELTDLTKDSDSDGVSDYHEKAMASGQLRLGTGVPLVGMDYQNPDSDGDTIKDGNEIQVMQSGSKVYVYMMSNPTKVDTDNDGVTDDVEREDVATNIGTHRLNALNPDTDGDGISDGTELGTFLPDYGYYRVSSNPFMGENFTLGSTGPVSYCFASSIGFPVWTKEYYSSGTLPDGRGYTIYTFMDTSAIPWSTRKMVEVDSDGLFPDYYLLFATAGNTVRGGQKDEIYRKATYDMWSAELSVDSGLLDVALNAAFSGDGYSFLGNEADVDNFLYYDNEASNFLSEAAWKTKHFEKRFSLNCNYDKYLPISSYEAAIMGFHKLPKGEAKYHMPAGITDELQAGASHKYIREDGLEAIYKLLRDGSSVEDIEGDYSATESLKLQENPSIGPTFNYSPNDSSKISDASIAHYYFDMLPFYWWGGVR